MSLELLRIRVQHGATVGDAALSAIDKKLQPKKTNLYFCDSTIRGTIILVGKTLYVAEALTDSVSRREAQDAGVRSIARLRKVKQYEIDPLSVSVEVPRGTQLKDWVSMWRTAAEAAGIVVESITEQVSVVTVCVKRNSKSRQSGMLYQLKLMGTTVVLSEL